MKNALLFFVNLLLLLKASFYDPYGCKCVVVCEDNISVRNRSRCQLILCVRFLKKPLWYNSKGHESDKVSDGSSLPNVDDVSDWHIFLIFTFLCFFWQRLNFCLKWDKNFKHNYDENVYTISANRYILSSSWCKKRKCDEWFIRIKGIAVVIPAMPFIT